MAILTWDDAGEKMYETGVDEVVLYVQGADGTYPTGVAWNGITKVDDKPSGAESTPLYANNNKYANLISNEEYAAGIEAYTYPDEFAQCNGEAELDDGITIGQQDRKTFGLSYRTLIGNDTEGTAKGYKYHIVYNCKAAPSEASHTTVNDSPEAMTFSWEISTTPVNVTGHKPTATVTFDSTKLSTAAMTAIKEALHGNATTGVAHLPTIAELIALVTAADTPAQSGT